MSAATISLAVLLPISGFAAENDVYWKPLPSQVIVNAVPYAARPLPLSAVRLTGGPLQRAQQLDAAYLLQLEPDRMLYYLAPTRRAGA